MKKIYTVYMATNKVNGKMYIGFDSDWPHRMKSHKKLRGDAPKFHSAIKKYGFESFEWSVLFQGWDRDFVLGFVEPCMIYEHQSQELGYNITGGGSGRHGPISEEHRQKTIARMMGNKLTLGRKLSKEHREKIGAKQRGKLKSNEHKAKIGKAQKGKPKATMGAKNGMFGKTHSDEVKKRLSEFAKTRTSGKNPNARKVFTPKGCFDSYIDAANEFKLTTHQIKYKVNATSFPDWGYIK